MAKLPTPPGPRVVNRTPAARASILGTAFSPANFPQSSDADLSQFFDLAAQLGSQVTVISAWKDRTPVDVLRQIEAWTHEKGMRFVLYLDPVALDSSRTHAAVPPGVPGTSFRDASVRTAYTSDALALVALRPDILGLGTEINLLAENAPEFDAYLSLLGDTVRAIKSRSPGQAVTVSFQWDFMLIQKKFDPLLRATASGGVDVYSFTTYPSGVGDPANLPADYYSSIRQILPTQRVGISEAGWPASDAAGEAVQAAYWTRMRDLVANLKAEFVTLALLNDVAFFTGDLEPLNHVGVRYRDGRPKKAWDVVRTLDLGALARGVPPQR
jgi:hypothetical protein